MSIIQSAIDRLKVRENPSAVSHAPAERTVVEQTSVAWPSSSLPPVDLSVNHLQRIGLASVDSDLERQREDYRYVRREVVEAMRATKADGSTPGPIVVVTSAMPGDGKSYTALNLAISLAAENVRDVLLVDGDSVKSSLTRIFNLLDAPGLVDMLRDSSSQVLQHSRATSYARLHVVPAGQRDAATADLFSAQRAETLFGLLRTMFQGHAVVIDAPPLLASSEAQFLANAADQVLLVVRAGVTLVDSVREAAARVRSDIPVGVVLNAWEPIHESERRAYQAYEDYAKRG
jgi:Mrp family chromosome partitioning ATPase